MPQKITSLIVALVSCSSLSASTYIDSISVDNSGFHSSTEPNFGGDGASILWTVDTNNHSVTINTYTVGVGFLLTRVDEKDILNTNFDFSQNLLVDNYGNTLPSFLLTKDTTFFVGLLLDKDYSETASVGDHYGWVKLEYDGTNLSLFGADIPSAMNNTMTTSGSLPVGSPNVASVPEPSSMSLLGLGVITLILRRRR